MDTLGKIINWLLRKVFESKLRTAIEPSITEMYRQIAKDNLNIRTEIVRVKKGKRKYELLFFQTPEFKLRFNLGRHWDFGNDKFEGELINENKEGK